MPGEYNRGQGACNARLIVARGDCIKINLTTEDTENTEINLFSAKNGGNVGAIYTIARFF